MNELVISFEAMSQSIQEYNQFVIRLEKLNMERNYLQSKILILPKLYWIKFLRLFCRLKVFKSYYNEFI